MIYTQVGNCCAVETVDNTTASTKLTQPEFRSETDLEAAIQAASDRMCAAPERQEKMRHWREMSRLMDQRSVHRWRFLFRLNAYESNTPPSRSVRIAKASAERSRAVAGGFS